MFIDGAERDEQEWKKIIFEAGFTDYKIRPVAGVRSIIEYMFGNFISYNLNAVVVWVMIR
ncbi:hypothetical protein EJB05_41478, partial [Eragrostis curvula]